VKTAAASLAEPHLSPRLDKLRVVPNPDTLTEADDRPPALPLVPFRQVHGSLVRQETICVEKRLAYPRKIT
jgi:hypothetical protein